VYSVTSDLAANASLQTAPPKSARPDPSPNSNSFGSLVDSNAAASTGNDRAAASAAQQQSASQHRADDNAAANADNSRSRNASADQAAKNASDDRNASAQQNSDANAAANTSADADAASQRSKAKSGAPKADATKPTDKSASGNASATGSSTAPDGSTPQGAAPAATPNPVAVALAVIVPVIDAPVATPVSGNATAPLAIAAAAIAASSAAGAPVAAAAQVKIDSNATAAVTASAATAGAGSDTAATATAKIAVQAAANAAIGKPVNPQPVPTGISDVALTVAPAAAVAPKTTLLKAAGAVPGKTATSGDAVAAPGTSDSPATAAPGDVHSLVAQQPDLAGKPDAANTVVDAAKANAGAASLSESAATVAGPAHSAIAATAHAPTDLTDTGAQPTGTFQSLLPAVTAAAAPIGPLSVTAASNAPVPLSGLAVEIAASVRSGKTHFEIRLDPADLGRIDVRIDVDRNGQVTSHLTVEKPETLSMLRQDAPQLQQALDDAGFKTGGGGLQFSLRDQSSSGQNNGNDNSRNAQRLIISEDDTMPAAVAGRSYGRSLGASSGVDIRV
jgi:flagellar hook-length control protein FliK